MNKSSLRLLLLIVFSLGLSLALTAFSPAQSAGAAPASAESCRYVMGFQTLHDLIPGVVGDCKTNEAYNPANGDSLQLTTKGLLVWRKADNFTAFTDGSRTWVNGPRGLQIRSNVERFSWESDAKSALPPVTSSPTPAATPITCASLPESQIKGSEVDVVTWKFEPGQNGGGTVVSGSVRNNCTDTRTVSINATIFDNQNRPVSVTPTQTWRLGAGQNQTFSLKIMSLPRGAYASRFRTESVPPDQSTKVQCVDVGTTRCLNLDPWLIGAINELRSYEVGSWLLRVAAENGVTIRREDLPESTYGLYSQRQKVIMIEKGLDEYSDWERAVVIAHELQHAQDDVVGKLGRDEAGCYRNEEDGFKRGAEVWRLLWVGKLPEAQNAVQEEFNAIARAVASDPSGFSETIKRSYSENCIR